MPLLSPATPTATAYHRGGDTTTTTATTTHGVATDSHRDSTASHSANTNSHSPAHSTPGTSPRATSTTPPTPVAPVAPITLALAIRRGRLALLTCVVLASILTIVFVFNRGVEIKQLASGDAALTDRDAQEKLLDDYNSYSANVATAFSKPIDVFVTIAVQIVLLRFMAQSVTTQNAAGWSRLGAATMVCGPGVLYLINNGFNAVNVQLRPKDVRPVISAVDLSAAFNDSTATSTSLEATSLQRTISELTPGNPITNTVLRNAAVAAVAKGPAVCARGTYNGNLRETSLQYGFRQRDWQSRVLATAPMATQWRMRLVPNRRRAVPWREQSDLIG